MIRYDVTEADLWDQIERQKPSWRTRADAATARFRQAGLYQEPPGPFWGEIKPVFMRLQKNKCAFCERKLTVRLKDHDVEHFRPKRAVVAWPPPGTRTYPFPTGNALPGGYHLLTYHPLNYAASCEHCNQGLKRSYFPIEGARMPGEPRPERLGPERPLLIYPVGRIDADPEELLAFQGVIPIPKVTDPDAHENHRAQVTIQFFDLQAREELRRERAEVLEKLHLALTFESTSERSLRQRARLIINRATSAGSQHTNCARSFVTLYRQDPIRAERLATLATRLLRQLIST